MSQTQRKSRTRSHAGGVAIAQRIAAVAACAAFSMLSAGAIAQPSVVVAAAPMGYLNGGIGEEQAELMRSLSAQFPIRFTFSRHNPEHNTDEFVADVRLRVLDDAGRTVLDLTGQGPIFLLRLPAGSYSVEAEHAGEVKTRRFRIAGDRHQEIAFSWAG